MDSSAENTFWKEVTVRNSRKSYQEYLDRYPNGAFHTQAERHLEWFARYDHRHLHTGKQQSLPLKWIVVVLLVIGAGLAIGYFI